MRNLLERPILSPNPDIRHSPRQTIGLDIQELGAPQTDCRLAPSLVHHSWAGISEKLGSPTLQSLWAIRPVVRVHSGALLPLGHRHPHLTTGGRVNKKQLQGREAARDKRPHCPDPDHPDKQ